MSYTPGRPHGEVFLDARRNGRALRLTWHHQQDVVVLSLWRDDVCAGTFRLGADDVADFVDALVDGMRDAPGVHARQPAASGTPAIPGPRQPARATEEPMPWTGQLAVEPRNPEPAYEPSAFADWAFGDDRPANAS